MFSNHLEPRLRGIFIITRRVCDYVSMYYNICRAQTFSMVCRRKRRYEKKLVLAWVDRDTTGRVVSTFGRRRATTDDHDVAGPLK